ncbi:MAG: hypothetical protein ABIE84_06995 [bacterium]
MKKIFILMMLLVIVFSGLALAQEKLSMKEYWGLEFSLGYSRYSTSRSIGSVTCTGPSSLGFAYMKPLNEAGVSGRVAYVVGNPSYYPRSGPVVGNIGYSLIEAGAEYKVNNQVLGVGISLPQGLRDTAPDGTSNVDSIILRPGVTGVYMYYLIQNLFFDRSIGIKVQYMPLTATVNGTLQPWPDLSVFSVMIR